MRGTAWLLMAVVGCGVARGSEVRCGELRREMVRRHIPDVAVATFSGGRVRTAFCQTGAGGHGLGTVFQAASLGKPVFAMAVLQLVKAGRLDLDRPLTEYLRSRYEHERNPFGEGSAEAVLDPGFGRITARMVLSHTSGLPNWSHDGPLVVLREPGREWSYSGEGYQYLGRVVEAITGQRVEDFVDEAVLRPLEMSHSSYVWRAEFAGQMAEGHARDGRTRAVVRFQRAVVASTLLTTVGDYARFVAEMLRAAPGSAAAMEETAQVEVRRELSLSWGLGVGLEETGSPSCFHWGANPGFQSFFLVQPSAGRGVLFLTDSDNGLELVDRLVRVAVPGVHPALRFPMLHPRD